MRLPLGIALCVCAATAARAEDPPPPSTGNEAPKAEPRKLPTNEEAKAMWLKVLAEAKPKERDCTKLIAPWTRVLFSVARPKADEVKKDLDAYLALARCAEKQKYYVLLGDLGDAMLRADPKNGHPELLARALLGLNSPQAALKVLGKAEAVYAKDPDVMLTTAKVQCRIRDWAKCLASADKTVKLVKKPKEPEGKEILNRAQKYRARAQLHLGKLEDAQKSVALSEKLGGDATDLTEVRKALVPARTYKAVVETDHLPIVPLGIYHLLGRADSGHLVRFFIDNPGEDRQFRVEAAIDGVTAVLTKTETILKGKSAVIDITPKLSPTFDLAALRASRPGQLNLKVTVLGKEEQIVYQDTEEVELKPRDFLPTATFVDEERALNEKTFSYIGAWVTPSGKSIEAFLADAKTRAPRNTFAGEQAATIPQVQALFDTLKARGVSYVMNPEVLAESGYGQRTRLPADVLASTNAQCLEGAILYAALMEAIGLSPAVVLVPGHAFVAWRTTPKDKELFADGGVPEEFAEHKGAGRYLFLETTMTHDGTFEKAVKVGGKEFDLARAAGAEHVLVMGELRKVGIAPQPYE